MLVWRPNKEVRPTFRRLTRSGNHYNPSSRYFMPREGGTFVVRITDPVAESTSRYSLFFGAAPDVPAGVNSWANVGPGSFPSELSSATDFDTFGFSPGIGRGYDIELLGNSTGDGTLANPIMRIYNDQGERIGFDNNSGTGTNASFRWNPTNRAERIFIEADGVRDAIGSYTLRITQTDDFVAGPSTTGRMTLIPNQTVNRLAILEKPDDIDWFKVDLEAGRRYQFRSRNGELDLLLRGPDNRIVSRYSSRFGKADDQIYFQAETSGTYHLVVRGNRTMEDFISITDNVAPALQPRKSLFSLGNHSSISLAEMLRPTAVDYPQYQVFPQRRITFDGESLEANRLYSFTKDQLSQVRVGQLADETGNLNLFVRGDTQGPNRYVTGWTNLSAYKFFDLSGQVSSGQFWDDHATYFFADSAPDYFGGQFVNPERVAGLIERRMNSVIRSWNQASDGVLRQATSVESADIVIFAADIGQDVMTSNPGDGSGGDIVLDSSVYHSGTDLSESRLVYQLNRAIGVALGLRSEVSNLRADESVVGTRDSSFFDARTWPETPSYLDARFLQNVYGPARQRSSGTEALYFQDPQSRTFIGQLPEEGGRIQASGFANTQIDLRRGKSTFRFVNGNYQAIHNGLEQDILEAIGSSRNDVLIGNANGNRLNGRSGNDVFFGHQGNDVLIGEFGSDFYHYSLGDGDDRIQEVADFQPQRNDVDTLRIEGQRFGFNELETDLSFQKLGNTLVINMDLNGGFNRRQGSIRINGDFVERLVLHNGAGQMGAAISLSSIYAQADFQARRFTRTGQFDEHGALVAPV